MKKIIPVFLVFLLALLSAPSAQAGGFYIQEQSVKGQGAAFAGQGANPQDASTVFFNPAGMTRLKKPILTLNTAVIVPRADLSNRGSVARLDAAPPFAAFDGANAPNPYDAMAVPSFFAAVPVTDSVWAGLGVSSPFGLGNDYGQSWFGRYNSTKNNLRTIDVSPAIAWQADDRLSIGGGVNIQYAQAVLENALPAPGVFTPATDGFTRLAGSGLAFGFNGGLLYDFDEATRFGLHYRSGISNELDGDVVIAGLAGGLAAFNGTRAAKARLKLPDTGSLSVAHDIMPGITLLGSANWYGWSNFNEIRVRFDNGDPDDVATQSYKNTWALALGLEWRATDAFTLRSGAQYDQTPSVDAWRSARIPDSDRYWLSAGASWVLGEQLSMDLAATHIFMENAPIRLTDSFYAGAAASTVRTAASSQNQIDILSLQLNWSF